MIGEFGESIGQSGAGGDGGEESLPTGAMEFLGDQPGPFDVHRPYLPGAPFKQPPPKKEEHCCGSYKVRVIVRWKGVKPNSARINLWGPMGCNPTRPASGIPSAPDRRGMFGQRILFYRDYPLIKTNEGAFLLKLRAMMNHPAGGPASISQGLSWTVRSPGVGNHPVVQGDLLVYPFNVKCNKVTYITINLLYDRVPQGGGPPPEEPEKNGGASPAVEAPFADAHDMGFQGSAFDEVDLEEDRPIAERELIQDAAPNCVSIGHPWTQLDICVQGMTPDSREAIKTTDIRGETAVPPRYDGMSQFYGESPEI